MILENALIRVELDPAAGGLRGIYDKQRGHEYVAAPDRALLLRLIAPEAGRPCNHLDGAAPQIEADGHAARLTFSMRGIRAVATLTLDGSSILAELELTNGSALVVEEIMFPWVRGLGPVPGAVITWPNFASRKVDDPFGKGLGGDHHTWNEGLQKTVARYPQYLATAWCDYGNSDHGIAIEGRHTDFSIMDFFVHKVVEKSREPVRRTLDLVTVHPRRVKPGASYASSPVRIFAHQGDWHTVADAHRAWGETWLQKPVRPQRFAKAMGWHFFFMKHQDGLVQYTYEDLPRLAQAALDAGCPYLLLFGWQTGGHDNNYFYRYVPNEAWGGAQALRKAIETCRAMGVEIMPFFNGTLANVELSEHKEFGHRWEAKTREGHAYYAGDWARHNFDAPTRNRSMLHAEIAFCREQRAYFLATMKRIVQDYGFGNTQLDQIAEKMFVDYHEDHIATTPDRVYVDGLAELLPAVRELIREVNPEGVMISEGLNEFTGQWCDSSWDWTVLLNSPEPILYSLPWLRGSAEIDALEYGEVNKAFVYNLHLDLKIDGGDAPITKYPRFAAHVKANAGLRERVADYHCLADFRDQEGIELAAKENIVAKVFHNRARKKVGIVVAEVHGHAREAALRARWASAKDTIAVESNTRAPESVAARGEWTLALEPYEVRVLCIDLG